MKRREAYDLGLKHYNTGVPCKRNHDHGRYVTTGGCIECSRMSCMQHSSGYRAGSLCAKRITIEIRDLRAEKTIMDFVAAVNASYEIQLIEEARDEWESKFNMPHPKRVTPPPLPPVASSHPKPRAAPPVGFMTSDFITQPTRALDELTDLNGMLPHAKHRE